MICWGQNPRFVRCTWIYKWFNRTLLQPHYLSNHWTVSPCSVINGSLFRKNTATLDSNISTFGLFIFQFEAVMKCMDIKEGTA